MSGPAYENVICEICGERFDRRIINNKQRKKINYCSSRCRNQYYHDKENREFILTSIEKNDLRRIGGFTVKMLLRLGFKVEVKSPV